MSTATFGRDGRHRDHVKLIFADLAHEHGTAEFNACRGGDQPADCRRGVALTFNAFLVEYGGNYAVSTISKLDKKGWVANYSGGFDYNTGKPSPDATAFQILWRPCATAEFEQW